MPIFLQSVSCDDSRTIAFIFLYHGIFVQCSLDSQSHVTTDINKSRLRHWFFICLHLNLNMLTFRQPEESKYKNN